MNELENAICIYNYGSFVYGTFIDGISDKDYIVVIPDNVNLPEQIEIDDSQFNIYKESIWIEKLKNNDVECLECVFLDDKYKIKENKKYDFILNKDLVRENISRTASNSYVKCKKKLTVKDSYNPKIGKKSLWHALRLLNFGQQIMKYGKIIDYSSTNHLYKEILNAPDDWLFLKEKYQPLYNKYKTEFKLSHNNESIER